MKRIITFLSVLALVATSAPPRDHVFHHRVTKAEAAANRLSGKILPLSYTLHINLAEDFVESLKFSGDVTISLNFTTAVSSEHLFYAKDLTLNKPILKKGSTQIEATFSDPDPVTDLVLMTSKEELEAGTYSLQITYEGPINDKSMVGIYLSSYIDPFKQQKYVVATQFENTHARKAFPSLDEPELKAPFTLYLSYPAQYHSWSNTVPGSPSTSDNIESVRFLATPTMSTYLLAFLIAEFNCKNADMTNNNKPVELCSRISAFDQSAKLALDNAPKLLNFMGDFVNYNYSVGKMTLAAIPDFAPGAMENWGLVTFREVDLLWDENEASDYDKQTVVTVIAHELSHQWFGDLVTMDWWSDLFLNEGVATYFEYHAADSLFPEWELQKQFVIEQLQSSLESDSLENVLPLSYDEADPEYSSKTIDLSYEKGGSILRMVQHFLGDNFKLGLADYITNNQFSVGTPEILWSSFDSFIQNLPDSEQPPKEMTIVMDSWTKKPGYPLLTVTSNGDDITITQEQFALNGKPADTKWYVPITYTVSSDTTGFQKTSTQLWLSPDDDGKVSGVLKNVDWIVLNNQQVGYYRVNYDDTLLQKISTALSSNIDSIDEISRAQIIDDQFNLARAGKKTYKEVFEFLAFLKNDDSYYSWYSAFNGFDYLLRHTGNANVRKALNEFVYDLLKTLLDNTPDEPDGQIPVLKQVLAKTWACQLGEESCITLAKQSFETYQSTGTKPDRNLKRVYYCNGLRNSDNPVTDFRFLYGVYVNAKPATEKVTLLKALGCVPDRAERMQYLSNIFNGEIRLQDASYVFSSVYANNPDGASDVIDFISQNYKQIIDHFGDTRTLNSVISSVADYITAQKQIDSLQKLSEIADLEESAKDAATAAIAVAKQNVDVTKKLEDDLRDYFNLSDDDDNRGSGTVSNFYFINTVCILAGYLLIKFF